MTYIPYKLALVRRDDLLRQAADVQLARETVESPSRAPGPSRRLTEYVSRRFGRLRIAARS